MSKIRRPISNQASWHLSILVQWLSLYYPLSELQAHTNFYLKKKGTLKSDDRDRRLLSLVRNHPSKEVAIAACAHALATPSLRELLHGESHFSPINHTDTLSYFRAIIGAHHANPMAVSANEANLAQTLISLSTPDMEAHGKHLGTFFSTLSASEPSELFRRPFIDQILSRACAALAAQLDSMRMHGQWRRAHEESKWLSVIPGADAPTEELLNSTFPTWRIWSFWTPDVSRLSRWERLKAQDREELRDILALEGPDFVSSEKRTLREGILQHNAPIHMHSVNYNRLSMKLADGSVGYLAGNMLDRLLNALDAAISTAPDTLRLFIYLCLESPMEERAFQILELVELIKSSSISTAVLNIITAVPDTVKFSATLQLLPYLNDGPGQYFRDLVTPTITKLVEDEVVRMQAKFCEQLQRDMSAIGMGMKLHGAGETLKDATWLKERLSYSLRSVLADWPEERVLESLLKLRIDVQITSKGMKSPLAAIIDNYLMAYLAGRGRGQIDDGTKIMLGQLFNLWQQRPETDRRTVALLIAQRSSISPQLRTQCLEQLETMKRDLIYTLSQLLAKGTDMACVHLASLLISEKSFDAERVHCWRGVLLSMIELQNETLLDYSLTHLDIQSWFELLENLNAVFGDGVISNPPRILDISLRLWSKNLSAQYMPVLTSMYNSMRSLCGLRWILTGWGDSATVLPILALLQESDDGPSQCAREALMPLLSSDGSNGRQICETISRLSRTTQTGTLAYLRVLELRQTSSQQTADAFLAVWLQSSELTRADKTALEDMATILGMPVGSNGSTMQSCLGDAAEYLENESSVLLNEACRLESLRLTLKADDSIETSALLARLGIEDISGTENSNSGIPPELLDVVESIGNEGFEMSFLLTHLKPLRLIGLGLGGARLLFVRLFLGDRAAPPRFCMHLHGEHKVTWPRNLDEHSYHAVGSGGSAPDVNICNGRANRAIYQLCRGLWRTLSGGLRSLELIYKSLAGSIDNLTRTCMVCGDPINCGLWRPTTCKKQCGLLLRRSNLEVRLVDLRLDPQVVDMLLSSVYAVAAGPSGLTAQLLIDCPVSDARALLHVANRIPAMATLQNASDLTVYMRGLEPQTEALLSWLCISYRGFLVTCPEALKIPSFPNVHQFLLANCASENERAFAAHIKSQRSSMVLFHGTSMDRLYSILRQGLRVQSRGALEQHGSAHGRGVYLAEEPSFALSYAARVSSSTWNGSSFHGVGVLLACELAGSNASKHGIHVISDPTRLIVRYVFLCPANATAPAAAHIVPALTSTYATLKSRPG